MLESKERRGTTSQGEERVSVRIVRCKLCRFDAVRIRGQRERHHGWCACSSRAEKQRRREGRGHANTPAYFSPLLSRAPASAVEALIVFSSCSVQLGAPGRAAVAARRTLPIARRRSRIPCLKARTSGANVRIHFMVLVCFIRISRSSRVDSPAVCPGALQ